MSTDIQRGNGRSSKLALDDIGREPPVSLEAERSVLGSIMLLPETIDDVVTMIRADDFYDDANRILFEHISAMHNEGRKIDITLLRQRLVDAGDYQRIGGPSYLAQVFTQVANAAHATYYAKIVEEKSARRRVILACTDILKNAYETHEDTDRLLADAEQRVFAVRDSRQNTSITTMDKLIHLALDRLEARLRGDNIEGLVETGFSALDGLLGGLRAAELIILAARPSMGKTALAMNIAENVARLQQLPVLFVSLEMSSIELIERLMCSCARVNSKFLRNGTLNKEDRKKLVNTAAELSKAPLFIDDAPARSVSQIAATSRRILRRHGQLGLIVVDYLQLIEPENAQDPRQEQVAKIARRLKGLSRELEVPLLCLSQLNRQAEDSRDHRPRLSHLRESGAIEQDADVVMFVHRPEYFLSGEAKQEAAGQAQVLVEKQRNGPTGTVDLTWIADFTRFEDRAPDRHSEFDDFGQDDLDFM